MKPIVVITTFVALIMSTLTVSAADSVQDRALTIMAEYLAVPKDKVDLSKTLYNTLGSEKTLLMIRALNEEFQIDLLKPDLAENATLGEVLRRIKRRKGE